MRKTLALIASLALFSSARAEESTPAWQSQKFDLVIIDATPSGVAMGVRAAREGLSVLIVNHTMHLGGMLTNGLGIWDTIYPGWRSPIFEELRRSILAHYTTTYGPDSAQEKLARGSRGRFEPKVAEAAISRLLAAEKNITVLKGWIPVRVDRSDHLIRSITLQPFGGGAEVTVQASIFGDASYEGDLLPLAKVPYRVGRENRAEYGEAHAGRIFTRMITVPEKSSPSSLNLLRYDKTQVVLPGGDGAGDQAIQAFNFRLILTNDPANRIIPEKPPAGYDPASFLPIKERWTVGSSTLPNKKGSWNSPLLIEGNWAYPEASWAERAKITARHRDFALGLLWFLQNDPSVPEKKRSEAQQWGLARDEFTDNANIPYEMYVREARRLKGRAVFTENDALLAPGLQRAPIRADSIGFTDWPLDSHECRLERVKDSVGDGKVLMTEETVPGQIPYDCLLPENVDNLLVPMCLSASHIGWGSIRLEPTVMQTGEAAGYAAALAIKNQVPPARLDRAALLRHLAENKVILTFFNDADLDSPWMPAAQYLGTQGFFASYDALPGAPLSSAIAQVWAKAFHLLKNREAFDPDAIARLLPGNDTGYPPLSTREFLDQLKIENQKGLQVAQTLGLDVKAPLNRGDACRLLFALLADR